MEADFSEDIKHYRNSMVYVTKKKVVKIVLYDTWNWKNNHFKSHKNGMSQNTYMPSSTAELTFSCMFIRSITIDLFFVFAIKKYISLFIYFQTSLNNEL